jgi:LPS export ABC transporter protein LptC
MILSYKNIFCKSIAILMGLAMLFSCKPDIKKIETITQNENLPIETADSLKIIYSSYGQIQMIMEAPTMLRFAGEKPYMELPDGFLMIFYDSLMNENSRISARYAIQYEQDQLIDTRNDVVVQNVENNETLNTEQLIWDQKNATIYTEKFVKITTNEEVLFGDGFESDDRFTAWRIKNPKGTFYVDTESADPNPENPSDTIF